MGVREGHGRVRGGGRAALACASCGDAVERDEAFECAACLAPYHAACFAAAGVCAGCERRVAEDPPRSDDQDGGAARPARGRAGGLVTATLAAALGSALAVTAWEGRDLDRADELALAPPPAPVRAALPPQAGPRCAWCGEPPDEAVAPARLGPEEPREFCSPGHRRAYLFERAAGRRGVALEGRVVAIDRRRGRARIDVGLLAGALPADRLCLWRAGRLVGRLTLTEVDDDRATGLVDLVTPGDAVEAGDVALRANDEAVWRRLEAQQRALDVLAEIADRAGRPRVLYLEGQPRWEYQHLRRALTRWTRAQVLLASADPGYVQDASEGLAPLVAPPRALDGWDVVVLGTDLRDAARALDLKGFVRGGGGLVLVPGAGGPRDLVDGARDLAPVAGGFAAATHTPLGDREALFRFGPMFDRARTLLGPGPLPVLQDVEPGRARDGADVQLLDARGRPVVASWSVGAGRVVYVGTDDLWRWRRACGEEAHAALWLEVIAWATGRQR